MGTMLAHRKALASQWTSKNPVLASGEIGFEFDTNKYKVGNGVTTWNSLPYSSPSNVTKFGTLLGDRFDGVRAGSTASPDKVEVSLTSNDPDGSVALNAKSYFPPDMYDIADVNWSPQSLGPYGAAYLNYTKANNIGTNFDFTTMLEGSHMRIDAYKLAGYAQDFRLWIDDEEVTSWFRGSRAAGVQQENSPIIDYVAADNALALLNLNFAERGIYKIRCAGVALSGTTGLISTNADGQFHKPSRQRAFAVISDSWYDVIPAHTSLTAGNELAARMGWKMWNLAVGGSGFVNPVTTPPTAPYNFGSDKVFESLAKAPELDMLLVNGSCNDLGYSESAVLEAMEAFFEKVRFERGDLPVVWQGVEPQSFFEATYTIPTIKAREEAMAEVAADDPNVIGIILCAEEEWLTGTGKTSAPSGSGNQDYIIGPDGVHLSKWGTLWNGVMVHERLKSMPTWR